MSLFKRAMMLVLISAPLYGMQMNVPDLRTKWTPESLAAHYSADELAYSIEYYMDMISMMPFTGSKNQKDPRLVLIRMMDIALHIKMDNEDNEFDK